MTTIGIPDQRRKEVRSGYNVFIDSLLKAYTSVRGSLLQRLWRVCPVAAMLNAWDFPPLSWTEPVYPEQFLFICEWVGKLKENGPQFVMEIIYKVQMQRNSVQTQFLQR